MKAKGIYDATYTRFNSVLDIEDEYVDNLMKQIHFMNLEIDTLYFY